MKIFYLQIQNCTGTLSTTTKTTTTTTTTPTTPEVEDQGNTLQTINLHFQANNSISYEALQINDFCLQIQNYTDTLPTTTKTTTTTTTTPTTPEVGDKGNGLLISTISYVIHIPFCFFL